MASVETQRLPWPAVVSQVNASASKRLEHHGLVDGAVRPVGVPYVLAYIWYIGVCECGRDRQQRELLGICSEIADVDKKRKECEKYG